MSELELGYEADGPAREWGRAGRPTGSLVTVLFMGMQNGRDWEGTLLEPFWALTFGCQLPEVMADPVLLKIRANEVIQGCVPEHGPFYMYVLLSRCCHCM